MAHTEAEVDQMVALSEELSKALLGLILEWNSEKILAGLSQDVIGAAMLGGVTSAASHVLASIGDAGDKPQLVAMFAERVAESVVAIDAERVVAAMKARLAARVRATGKGD